MCVAAGALTGCGGGRAAGGPVTAPLGTPSSSSRVRAQQQAVHEQVTRALKQHASGAVARYGGAPGFLPKTAKEGRILDASSAHRILAIQGDTVHVHLTHGSAKLTAVGPDVPDRVIGTDAARTATRFEVTLSDVHGTVPVTGRLFTVTDQRGHVYLPSISVKGGGRPPASVSAGRPVTMVLRTTLPEGDGLLRYGFSQTKPIVGWDFTVETD